MYEEQLRDPIISFLSDSGFRVYDQIPLFNGKIDFVGINNQNQCIVIETKISKWKDALKQALSYGYGADYVYVAMPYKIAKYISENYFELFDDYNIGLIGVKEEKVEVFISSFKPDFSQTIKNKLMYNIEIRESNSEERIENLKVRYKI